MERNIRYMVKREGQLPTLLRIEPDGKEKVFYSGNFEHSDNFYWIYAPKLEDIVDHKERYPEYVDITVEEEKAITQQLKAEYARIEEEKHVIHMTHSQKYTEKGIVLIDTYAKEAKRRYFRDKELEKLLTDLAEKENMVVEKISYSFYDFWGYRKNCTSMTMSKEDISEICDIPISIDGYFTDREMNIRFMYSEHANKVIIAKCLKDTGINLRAVFDEETNRKVGCF